jgi:hypothetical protein
VSDTNPVIIPDWMPGKFGGKLKRGGTNPGAGRPRSEVRAMLVKEFVAQLPQLKRDVKAGKLDRLKFAEMCAKYGLGTTVTETDTEGNDAPRPGILSPDERRAALIRELSQN